jgi:hypothetical protein
MVGRNAGSALKHEEIGFRHRAKICGRRCNQHDSQKLIAVNRPAIAGLFDGVAFDRSHVPVIGTQFARGGDRRGGRESPDRDRVIVAAFGFAVRLESETIPLKRLQEVR